MVIKILLVSLLRNIFGKTTSLYSEHCFRQFPIFLDNTPEFNRKIAMGELNFVEVCRSGIKSEIHPLCRANSSNV